MAANPLQVDPTRTTMLRRRFIGDIRRRWRTLNKAVQELIVDEDAFGFNIPKIPDEFVSPVTFNTRFAFETDPQKIRAFQQWFREQVALGILEVPQGVDPTAPWTGDYTTSAYKKGVLRSYVDANQVRLSGEDVSAFYEGSKSQFIEEAFNGPIGTKQLEMLSTRSYEALKTVTSGMEGVVARNLTDGFSQGLGPRQLARRIKGAVSGELWKAERVARTEIIHAYAEGQLDSLEKLGVEEVGVMVEWLTAGDDRVCGMCSSLEGALLKIDEARGMIPRHPNCRCAWIPANVGEKKEKGQKRSRRDVERSIERSLRRERPKAKSTKEARRQSTWVGADKRIQKRKKT